MKLDYSCVRDLLLTLEQKLNYTESNGAVYYDSVGLSEICNSLPEYSKETIAYASEKLIEAEYIDAICVSSDECIVKIVYSDITFERHQYLNSVRENAVWHKVKPVAGQLTLDAVKTLATKFALSLIP